MPIALHGWVGPASAGGSNDVPCEWLGCGRFRLDEVHTTGYMFKGPESVSVVPDSAAVQAWDVFAAQVRVTIVRKSAGYGDAWEAQGYMGNLARILSKASRLKNLQWADREDQPVIHSAEHSMQADLDAESTADNAIDLAALCAFFVANVEGGNRWGR